MGRFRERFEVKNEMSDGGKIRPDDSYKQNGGKTSSEQQKEIIEDAEKSGGFDDFDYEFEQEDIAEAQIEENQVILDDEVEIDEDIKNKVNNYESCSIDEIEEILNYIADRKRKELGIDFTFETIYDTGGCVRPDRTQGGLQQVEIGYQNIVDMKDNKEMKRLAELGQIDIEDEIPEVSPIEERKEFIELILATHHELRHVKQNDNLQDNPISNEDNKKMTREHVINHFFTGFRNAYNYEQSIIEVDAMRASLEETARFFQEMGSDITPDEVFAVMKEKELSYLGYDLSKFGDSYESAITHFDQIYGKTTEIKGIAEIISSLPEDKKGMFFEQCQDLMDRYTMETDIEKRLELLESMALRMSPKLKEQYPLANTQIERSKETYEQNGREENKDERPKITNLDIEQELEKYYDDSVDIVTLKAYLKEKIPQVYGDRLEKLGVDIDKYLESIEESLEYFEGAESYMQIATELESQLDELEEATIENRETQELEKKLEGKEEKRILRNEVRDVGEQEFYEQNDREETGFVLKSVNGRDILSSAIEATEGTTRESTISQQSKALSVMQKERSEVSKGTQTI